MPQQDPFSRRQTWEKFGEVIRISFTEYLLGKRSQLAWVDETSFGSGGDMAADGIPVGINARIEPDFNQNWQEILSAGSTERTVEDFEEGPLDLPFTLTFTPTEWKWLKYCGYAFTNTGASSPYTHTGTLQDAIQSFKLQWAINHTTPVVFTLTGCFVMSATLNFAKGTGEGGEGLISVSLRCQAQGVSIGSSITSVSATTRTPFQFRHVKVTLNNVETVEVNNGEITIDQGIDTNDSRYCNATLNRAIGEAIPKTHRLNGRYSININDDTEIDLWNGAASVSNCKLEIIENSSTNKIVMQFDKFYIPQGIPSLNYDAVYAPDVVWRATKFSSIVATDSLDDY